MKKILSIALTGAIALSSGVFCPAPGFSTVAEESVEYTEGTYEMLTYKKYADYVEISGCNKEATEVVIPDEIEGLPVTSIGMETFSTHRKLVSVTIPDSVTKIGSVAFNSCTNLTSVSIPDSVSSIGGYAFYNCKSLTSVDIPNSVKAISGNTFGICTNLVSVSIPDSVQAIGDSAFSGCNSLVSLTIPDSVTKIGSQAFSYCKSLKSVIVPSSVESISIYAFGWCDNLESLTIENPDCAIYSFKGLVNDSATIYGYPDSTAQAYAEKYGYKFAPIGEQTAEALKGDANGDNSVTIADAVAILQYLANSDEYPLSEQGAKNADVLNDDGVNTEDALQIQKLDAGVIESL